MSDVVRVLVFGTTGAGKTSVCNELANEDNPVGHSIKGVTFKHRASDPIKRNGKTYIITDTVGLNESDKGSVPAKDALKSLVQLLRDSRDGYNLLIHVFKVPRATESDVNNYKFFVETIADSKIPAILIATGCENLDPMSRWGTENEAGLQQLGLTYKGVVCGCFAKGGRLAAIYDGLRRESLDALWTAIDTHAEPEPVILFTDPFSFDAMLRRGWNAFCEFLGVAWKLTVNETLQVLLTRMGFTSREAEYYAENGEFPEE